MSKTKWIAAAAVAVAALGAGTGIAVAQSNGDHDGNETDTPITGSALDEAERAALAETGGGHVSDTEVGDEESYYEVEVTLDDGSQVDVQLDRHFNVVGQSADEESPDDQ